jgi:hypothetical protein
LEYARHIARTAKARHTTRFQSTEWIAEAGAFGFLGWGTLIGLSDRLKNYFGMHAWM